MMLNAMNEAEVAYCDDLVLKTDGRLYMKIPSMCKVVGSESLMNSARTYRLNWLLLVEWTLLNLGRYKWLQMANVRHFVVCPSLVDFETKPIELKKIIKKILIFYLFY